jgi:multisubunit Na+/H+ antiporter MnhB subunit
MVSLIFIVLTAAMVLVWRGHRSPGMAAFALAAVLAVVWFNHHITDPLQLGF